MSTVQFSPDAIDPVTTVSSHGNPGGVYSIRNRSRTRSPLPRAKLDFDDNGEDLKKEGDLKEKQEFKGWLLLWLAYQSTGVIYGDIGTSPLYVFSSTFSTAPVWIDLVGATSLIIWAITLMVSIKYVLIVLNADDQGEGGTFAVYSLLSRYANIVKRDPKEMSMVKFERHQTSELGASHRHVRSGIENSRVAKVALKIIGVFGVSLVMADGVLTPAQSVLGAIQGLKVVKPDITIGAIVGITCAILICLFLIQPLGTSKIASGFAPIVIVWLTFNAVFGIYNLAMYDHSVLKAFSPYFAGDFLVRNGTNGWKSLGGILLAFTGCEALFADLGAFSKRAVQLGWLCFAFPCLLLAYVGQAAFISVNPDAFSNPFFNCVPPGLFYPSLVVAILAAIVASQALITSTFQLLSQVMKLSYFPQIKVVHTSRIFYGQIYIPLANWLLMIGTVIVAAVYNNTTSLGNAYGVCVILVTFITTCMVSLVALIIWRINPIIVAIGFLAFAALDGAFLSSALVKVPDGAWFTLVLACLLSSVLILWRFGKEQQWKAEASDRFPPSSLVKKSESGHLALSDSFGGGELTQISGFALFFDKAGDMTPTVFIQFLSKFVATPEVMVFLHLRPLPKPSVPPEDRYTVTEPPIPNCYRLVIRHGYMDEVVSHDLALLVYEQIKAHIVRQGAKARRISSIAPGNEKDVDARFGKRDVSSSPSTSKGSLDAADDPTLETANRLASLASAYRAQVLYIVGKEQMRIPAATTSIPRRIALSAFLWLRDNTRSKMAAMNIPTDRLVEVGFVKEV